jgi:hypothetical protein
LSTADVVSCSAGENGKYTVILSRSSKTLQIYKSGSTQTPQVMSLDASYFEFTSPTNIACTKNSILIYGPEVTNPAPSIPTTFDVAIITTEQLDNPFKRLLTIIKK